MLSHSTDIRSLGTFCYLIASGLNSGYSINCKNKFNILFLNGINELSGLCLFSISASLSIRSTISRVKLQSNSFMVHLTCSRTSSLSSMLTLFWAKPLYRSYSSRARVVNGVSTITAWPSFFTHLLAAEMVSRNDITLSCLFLTPAWFLSLSIVCRRRTSFLRRTLRATLRSSSLRLSLFLILCVSLLRHISNSCYNTLKSSDVLGCILLSISFLCFSSWSLSMVSFFSNFCLSCSNLLFLSSFTNFLANHPLTQHCMYNAFFSLLSAHFSESN